MHRKRHVRFGERDGWSTDIRQRMHRAPSLLYYSLEGWKQTYRDLRDFLDFFLVKNEYGSSLVDPPKFMNLTSENRDTILGIVGVCLKYEKEVREDLDKKEAQTSVELGKKLVSGELTIRKLLASRGHYT